MNKLFPHNIFAVIGLVSCAILMSAGASHAALDPNFVVYDSISGLQNGVNGAFTSTNGTPRNFIGDAVNFIYPTGGPVTITGMDLGFAYRGTATTLSALTVNLKFYETTSPDNSVLSNAVTSVLSFDARQPIVSAYNAQNNTNFTVDNFVFNPGTPYFYQLEFPTTFAFADQNLNGLAINYTANAGAGTFTDDTLTSVLRVGPELARGSSSFPKVEGGFFRNFGGRTDYNFDQSDARTISAGGFTQHGGVAMRFYSDRVIIVPEASTFALFGLGALSPVAALVVRRRKK